MFVPKIMVADCILRNQIFLNVWAKKLLIEFNKFKTKGLAPTAYPVSGPAGLPKEA